MERANKSKSIEIDHVVNGYIRNCNIGVIKGIINLIIQYADPSFHCFDSSILKTVEQKKLFADLLISQQPKFRNNSLHLLFRASENNFSAYKFHQICDKKGPTLVLIQSEFGAIFGGYTAISWEKNGNSKKDSNAFLFNVIPHVKIHKLSIDTKHHNEAVYHFEGYGPFFGGGCGEIKICNCCHLYAASICNKSLPNFSPYNVRKGSDLCGSKNGQEEDTIYFKCTEYEVYTLHPWPSIN